MGAPDARPNVIADRCVWRKTAESYGGSPLRTGQHPAAGAITRLALDFGGFRRRNACAPREPGRRASGRARIIETRERWARASDDLGDDAEEEQVDMKALAKNVDLKEMVKVLQVGVLRGPRGSKLG